MAKEKRLVVVIINYRTGEKTLRCLDSVVPQLGERDAIVVIDNASGDDSADLLEKEIPSRGWSDAVRLVRSPTNRGFAGGNNLGITTYDADFYLPLNSDAILHEGCLEALLTKAIQEPKAGIVSPRIESLDGKALVSCFRNHSPLAELLHSAKTGPLTALLKQWDVPIFPEEEITHPPWTSFACILLRAEAIEEIGLMDDGYFMYYEDNDYCRTLRKAGWEIIHHPEARIEHVEGGSSGIGRKRENRERLPRYFYRARARYYRKWYGPAGLILANTCWHIGRAVSFLRELIRHKKPHICKATWRDIWVFD